LTMISLMVRSSFSLTPAIAVMSVKSLPPFDEIDRSLIVRKKTQKHSHYIKIFIKGKGADEGTFYLWLSML
ncbi:MAG: hypothetical protein IJZ68_13125, partial [Bacteroidaceae bacterium]|nr:hypothetical protein [Bacteroidaceae bacterium]